MTTYNDQALSVIDPIARQNLTILTKGVGASNYCVDMGAPMSSLFKSKWLFDNFLQTVDEKLQLNGTAVKLSRENSINDLITLYVKANDTDERSVTLMYPFINDSEAFHRKHPEKKFTFGAGDYKPFETTDLVKLTQHLWTTRPCVGYVPHVAGVVNYDFIHYWNSRAPEHMHLKKDVIYMYDKALPIVRPGEIAVTKRSDGVFSIITQTFQIRQHHNLWVEMVTGQHYPDKFRAMDEFPGW